MMRRLIRVTDRDRWKSMRQHVHVRRAGLLMGLAMALAGVLVPATARAQASLQPAGWDSSIRLPEPKDLNADPKILEINIDASVVKREIGGRQVDVWAYNGGIPGPVIRLKKGDRLIAHFTNHLPQPSTIHWHGVRLNIEMDGVPDISQPAVEPGESFTYDFIVPDAGLFWYHPHVMSAAQVGFGLYGALLVEDPDEKVGVDDQLVLVLSDIGIDEKGQLEDPNSGGSAGMVFGREGTHVLVNGLEKATLTARSGAPQRWRVVNTAKSRYFELYLKDEMFTVIGGDGGLQEFSEQKRRVVIGAGERVDLIVTPHAKPGSEIILRSLLYNRGYGSVEYREQPDLVTIKMSPEPTLAPVKLPEVKRTIEPIPARGATPVEIQLTLAQNADGVFEYGINGVAYPRADHVTAKVNETQLWTVQNTTLWSHPLHLHGFFFQVVDDKGEPVHPIVWKDTVNIPLGETRRFLVKFDDRQGEWMYHCHILDHAEGGLMSTVLLGDVKSKMHHMGGGHQ